MRVYYIIRCEGRPAHEDCNPFDRGYVETCNEDEMVWHRKPGKATRYTTEAAAIKAALKAANCMGRWYEFHISKTTKAKQREKGGKR